MKKSEGSFFLTVTFTANRKSSLLPVGGAQFPPVSPIHLVLFTINTCIGQMCSFLIVYACSSVVQPKNTQRIRQKGSILYHTTQLHPQESDPLLLDRKKKVANVWQKKWNNNPFFQLFSRSFGCLNGIWVSSRACFRGTPREFTKPLERKMMKLQRRIIIKLIAKIEDIVKQQHGLNWKTPGLYKTHDFPQCCSKWLILTCNQEKKGAKFIFDLHL